MLHQTEIEPYMILATAHSQEQTNPTWGKGIETTRECLHIPQKIQNVRAAVYINHPGAPLWAWGGRFVGWVPELGRLGRLPEPPADTSSRGSRRVRVSFLAVGLVVEFPDRDIDKLPPGHVEPAPRHRSVALGTRSLNGKRAGTPQAT